MHGDTRSAGLRRAPASEDRPAGATAHAAFTTLMVAHEATIARYLRHLVGDAEAARDLTQETFLSAYRAWAAGVPANPGGWLYRVATNHAFAYLRRRRLIAWLPLGARAGSSGAAHDPPDERVAGDAAVAAALAALPPRQRACLLLSIEGFDGPAIAAQLGIAPAAARMNLARAREAFRARYDGHAPGEV